jgi:hypothetical protein
VTLAAERGNSDTLTEVEIGKGQAMNLTEQEIEMVEFLRDWSEHREVKFTASFKNGVWELGLVMTSHPDYLSVHPPGAVW